MPENKLHNFTIVLHQPRFPENIGSTARAMRNMGIHQLVVVDPVNYNLASILKLATHAASDVVENIKLFKNLKEALVSFNYIVGTTARIGKRRQIISSPSKITKKLISISRKNKIAIVFGPEDRGLSNEDIRFCHALVNIPTAGFDSLNLAQAVMIMCYEINNANRHPPDEFLPRLAKRHELDGMYDQLKEILLKINYINPENPDYWMNRLRQFGNRIMLRANEVSIIRGIIRQMNWYANKRYTEGQKTSDDKPY